MTSFNRNDCTSTLGTLNIKIVLVFKKTYVPGVRHWVVIAIPPKGVEGTDCVDACVCAGVDAGASQSAGKAGEER